jgi:hypothetical protein
VSAVETVTARSRGEIASSAAADMLELFTDPEYLQLLGKGIGLGVGIGALARVSPQLAISAAFIGGAYYAWECLAWVERTEERRALEAKNAGVVDAEVLSDVLEAALEEGRVAVVVEESTDHGPG